MHKPKLTILWRMAGKKATVAALFTLTAVISFATLGDGRKGSDKPGSIISVKTNYKPGSITLRSNYTYRGSTILNNNISSEKKVIRLNSTVTLQKGNTSINVPLKKNLIVSRISLGINNKINQRN